MADDSLVHPIMMNDGYRACIGAKGSEGVRCKIHLALAGTVINLIIFAMFAAFFSASLSALYKQKAGGAQNNEPVHLVIDNTQLKSCPLSPTISDVNSLPCLQKDGRYLTSEKSLGPWKCFPAKDPAANSCPEVNGSRIEIKQAGVYLVVVQTLVVDSLASPVALLLTVRDQILAACSNNVTGTQLPCSITTAKRLSAGDWLVVRLPQAFRSIDSHYSITYVDLMRLGDTADL